jgi:preprotein translocase subunit SecF
MKKVIHFSRLFLVICVLSALAIISGAFRIATRGINFGLDFAPGLLNEVRIAPAAFSLAYNGTARVVVQTGAEGISIIVTGAGAENTTENYFYAAYPTVESLTGALSAIDGISVNVTSPPQTQTAGLFVDASVSTVLTPNAPYLFHYVDAAFPVTVADVRDSLASIEKGDIKQVGSENERAFQIRVPDTGEAGGNQAMQEAVLSLLRASFGRDSVAVIRTDFIGASFSQSLALKSIITVLFTLVLIWVYSTIRFKWDFALGAVIAITHDALIMFAFISWTQIEFSTVILASILTIIGYSINDTIVVLDRVRENMKTVKVKKFTEHLDMAQTEVLTRTIITTITTMLAVLSFYVFTTGSMKDFALCLIAGMISGVYSTIFITGGFIALCRKNWQPSDKEKITLVQAKPSRIQI